MNLTYEVKGLDKLKQRLEGIASKLPTAKDEIVEKCSHNMSNFIRVQAPANTGKLRESIKYEITESNPSETKGRVYADMSIAPYALWVNYGTGIYADGRDKDGKHVASQASRIPWFVPKSKANLDKYGFPTYTYNGEEYYIMYGIHPSHFFDEAPFLMREDNKLTATYIIKNMMEG